MQDIKILIQSNVPLWDVFFEPNIQRYWKDKTELGRGGTGVVYDMGDRTVCKVQTFFGEPSRSSNDCFYENSGALVYIKESFLHEALVMQQLHGTSYLIPNVYKCAFGKVNGTFVSIVIMEKVVGTKYRPYGLSQKALFSLWHPFLQELSKLYDLHHFIHGDLIADNIVLHKNKTMVLIDFGLSSFSVNQVLYCRYHSFKVRLLPTLLRDDKMIQLLKHDLQKQQISFLTCSTIYHFLQRHRQAIDICKLFSTHVSFFSPSFKKKLQTCVGGPGRTILGPSTHPNPFYYSIHVITFREAIHETRLS